MNPTKPAVGHDCYHVAGPKCLRGVSDQVGGFGVGQPEAVPGVVGEILGDPRLFEDARQSVVNGLARGAGAEPTAARRSGDGSSGRERAGPSGGPAEGDAVPRDSRRSRG